MLVERSAFFSMGVSIRTENYRYTEWTLWNTTALVPRFEDALHPVYWFGYLAFCFFLRRHAVSMIHQLVSSCIITRLMMALALMATLRL